jgi:filamentous hemagglutinin
MEEKYGTKDWNKILADMTDKEYDDYSVFTCANPVFNKKGIDFFDESGKMRLGVVRDAVTSGKVSLDIKSRQNLHMKGHKDYVEGRSYFEADTDISKLVDELKGTGEPIFDLKGEWTNKERVVAKSCVGVHVDGASGKETPTKNLTIIYSKDGCHVVPGRSKEK